MHWLTYIVVLGVIAAVAYILHGRDVRVRAVTPRARIAVCVTWSQDGVPPVVSSLFARATYPDRLSFVVCARASADTAYPVKFVSQREFAGEALGHKPCWPHADAPWLLCAPARATAIEGWDAALEHAWGSTGDARAVLSAPATAKPSFLCAERVGTRGVHTVVKPMQTYKPVRTAFFTHTVHFGPREHVAALTLLAPSQTTSDTLSSWQLVAAEWRVYCAPAVIVGEAEPAPTTYHVRPQLDAPSSKAWKVLSDVGDPCGPRAGLGLVAVDGEEAVAKYGSVEAARAALSRAQRWPTVTRVE